MNELMVFKGTEVEVFELNGEVFFNASNVAKCLDIVNVNKNITNMERYRIYQK